MFDDDEQDEVKKELVIPKYKLLYQDLEIDLRKPAVIPENENEAEAEEEKKEEEEAKIEENVEQEKELSDLETILKLLAEILQENAEAKEGTPKFTDKELAMKLKEKLDREPRLMRPSVSNEEVEENGVWQVIIGKQFAASVCFDSKYIYYFQLEESRKYFLVFRS